MDVKSTDDGERFPRRAAAARATRASLVAAASELFTQSGYGATTVQQIAGRAGVGRATVFTSVPGGKPELLRLARDVALAGDDEPVPIPQRTWFLDAMAQPDGHSLLRRQAGNYRRILQRAAALELELQAAAKTKPELAALAAEARLQRTRGAGLVVQHLSQKPPGLKPDLSSDHAADIICALSSASLWKELVNDRKWSPNSFEQWLAQQLIAGLLPNSEPSAAAR